MNEKEIFERIQGGDEKALELLYKKYYRMMTKLVITNSGTEANETAVLLAQIYTKCQDVITLRHSYSGRSYLALSLSAPAFAADAESCKTVRFSDVGWTDITATTAAASERRPMSARVSDVELGPAECEAYHRF